jgi:tRNA (cmo5U34)-methyltransferase
MLSDWRDPDRVADYPTREIPHRNIAERMLLDALPRDVGRVLDLGTGDGRMLSLVLSEHPDAHAVGIDSSQPMLARATKHFAANRAVELRAHDLNESLPPSPPVDVVVSGLGVHHVSDERKRTLFAEIHALLTPGGVLANLDLMASASDRLHQRFRQAIGRAHDDPSDQLAGLCHQLTWLHDAGFTEVECHFKWLEFALIIAARRTSRDSRP